jgi:hypothetical protein
VASGFDRLRAGLVVGAVGTTLVPALAHVADARPASLAVHTSRGHDSETFGGPYGASFSRAAYWGIQNSVEWPTNSSVHAYGIGTAGRFTAFHCFGPCPSSGSTSAYSLVRGLDLVEINGTPYVNPDGTVDQTTSSITSDPVRVERIRTQIRHDFFGFDDKGNTIVRVLISMTNPTRHTLHRTIDVGTHLKAGTSAFLTTSSDGDQDWESSDVWDQFYDEPGAPSTLLVRGDNPISTVKNDPEGNGNAVDEFTLTFKPHQTRRLLLYAAIGTLIPGGTGRLTAIAHHFDNSLTLSSNGLLTGLTATERKQVVNWTGLS